MGGGSWSTTSYAATTGAKIKAGTTFSYDSTVRSTGVYKAHKLLDPTRKNAAGLNIREARDSADHPNSLPIVVGFDVTGSMGNVPRVTQEKLGGLFELLVRKGYCEDPALAISAYGDAYCDRIPLQISQFESSNVLEEPLDSLTLEGGGGGNSGETQTLLWYYLVKHTATDAWEKRGKKGYLFVIADEVPLDLRESHVKEFIGDEDVDRELLTAKALANAVQERWDTYILLVNNSTAAWQDSENVYTKLFGRGHVIIVQDPNAITETIGAAIGRLENDDIDDDDLVDDLVDAGSTKAVALMTAKSVSGLRGTGRSVAKGNASLSVDDDSPVTV